MTLRLNDFDEYTCKNNWITDLIREVRHEINYRDQNFDRHRHKVEMDVIVQLDNELRKLEALSLFAYVEYEEST